MRTSTLVEVHTYRGVPIEDLAPPTPTIVDLLDRHAATHGDDPFLTAVTADGRSSTLSYRELQGHSRRTAAWLHHELELDPGTVIGLIPRNDVESVVTVFAALRAGCPALMLNPGNPAERSLEQVTAVGASLVLRSPADDGSAYPGSVPMPSSAPSLDGPAFDRPVLTARDDALLFGTSGSTAASKVVLQSHANAVVNANAVVRHHSLGRGSRLLGCLPIHHVNGLHFTVFGTLAAGAHVHLVPGFDPFGYPALLDSFRPHVASVVPTILEVLLETWRAPRLGSEFQHFVTAAAPMAQATARAIDRAWSCRVVQGYGLTETTNFSTTVPVDLDEDDHRLLTSDADIPSIGVALEGNTVEVLDPEGRELPVGEIGEICVRGHNVMTGYATNHAATEEAFAGGWFHSGDLGFATTLPATGQRCFSITGRSKNVAKVRGESISLEELERALLRLDGVRDAACTTAPDRFQGERITAIVVADDRLSDTEIINRMRTRFDAAVVPSLIARVDAIPRSPTGKLHRAGLRELVPDGSG